VRPIFLWNLPTLFSSLPSKLGSFISLEAELGFKLFDRLPRGVKLSAAGRLFLEDARRILQQVSEAAVRAARVGRGQSGTLRVGFTENASWRGIVPDSFRRFRPTE
jgi:DNA-binding transcriptional LysR family regulator